MISLQESDKIVHISKISGFPPESNMKIKTVLSEDILVTEVKNTVFYLIAVKERFYDTLSAAGSYSTSLPAYRYEKPGERRIVPAV